MVSLTDYQGARCLPELSLSNNRVQLNENLDKTKVKTDANDQQISHFINLLANLRLCQVGNLLNACEELLQMGTYLS